MVIMKEQSKSCPRCKAKMEKGRLYTAAGGSAEIDKLLVYVNLETTEERKKYSKIDAYRCEDCGYVEFYAPRIQA
jgi:rubrerythrin